MANKAEIQRQKDGTIKLTLRLTFGEYTALKNAIWSYGSAVAADLRTYIYNAEQRLAG